MTTAVKNAGRVAPEPRQSQWAVVAREFGKRRLAVASLFVILSLITISIFAPLLANDRPIYFVGINRFEFREASKNARGLLGQLANQKEFAPETNAALVRSLRLQFELMFAELSSESSGKLHAIQERIEQALADRDTSRRQQQLRELQTELRPLLNSLEPLLLVRTHWPVFRSLLWSDLGFMAANVLLLSSPLWSRWVAPRHADSRPRRTILVLVVIPAVCAAAWWWLVPHRVDRANYKSGVLAADDVDRKAGVVFQSVMWPPIAYAIDEYDLAGKSAPPAWYPQTWRPKPVSSGNVATSETSKKLESRWSTPHWMGTDQSGRDVLCRMIWGGRVSLSVGFVAVAIYVSIGVVVGALAGYFRGVCDLILSRIIEVVICFPSFFLILTIVVMVGPGLLNIMVVIGLTGWTGIARLVRGEFLRLVDQEFVLAGKALGYSPLRLIFRHVLPNAMAPVLVSATFGIAGAILTESALSFLGLGIQAPIPSWGSLLFDGRSVMDHAPWLIHFPGLAIFITITSYNLIGEALRDAADPRLRGSR